MPAIKKMPAIKHFEVVLMFKTVKTPPTVKSPSPTLYNLLDFSTTTMLSAYAREEAKVQKAMRAYNPDFYTN